jgi:hypothetical protein
MIGTVNYADVLTPFFIFTGIKYGKHRTDLPVNPHGEGRPSSRPLYA